MFRVMFSEVPKSGSSRHVLTLKTGLEKNKTAMMHDTG